VVDKTKENTRRRSDVVGALSLTTSIESGGGNSNGDDEQILACDLRTHKAIYSEETNGAAEKLPSIHGAEPAEANVTTTLP
jgi:hypothetical protein